MNELQVTARCKIREGKLEEFKRVVAQIMGSVRTKDAGTLQYELFFSGDHSECVVLERFRDSDALLEHNANVADTMPALLETCSVSGEILGTPSPKLLKALEGLPVRIYAPYLSM